MESVCHPSAMELGVHIAPSKEFDSLMARYLRLFLAKTLFKANVF